MKTSDEIVECRKDIMHFVDEYCEFGLLDHPRNILVNMVKNKRSIDVCTHAAFVSELVALAAVHRALFVPNQVIGIVGISATDVKRYRTAVCDLLDRLPEWMQPELTVDNKNVTKLANGSKILYFSSKAHDLTRGFSFDRMYFVDMGEWRDVDVMDACREMFPVLTRANVSVISRMGYDTEFSKLLGDAKQNKGPWKTAALY